MVGTGVAAAGTSSMLLPPDAACPHATLLPLIHAPASMAERRHRIHELVLALIAQQDQLELLDGEEAIPNRDPASWLQRNRRLLLQYQALVRTAVTIDALIDQEAGQT